MKKVVVFERRNASVLKNNDLVRFEKFDSIVMSLRDSTYIEVLTDDGGERIVIKNRKYYLSLPANLVITQAVCKDIVLRRITLNMLDLLLLFTLYKEGVVEAGRVEELSQISSSDSEARSRVIELVS